MRLLPTTSVAIALTLLAPALAQAKPPRPKSEQLSAISQYRESLPSAAGPVYPGSQPPSAPAPAKPGKSGGGTPAPPAPVLQPQPLPKHVAHALRTQGGKDANALKTIATSPERGAPARPLPKLHDLPVHEGAPPAKPAGVPHSAKKAVFAAVRAPIADAGHGRLLWLLVIALVIAAVAVAARWRTRFPSP